MISSIAAQSGVSAAGGLGSPGASHSAPQPGNFLNLISDALQGVSAQQSSAATAEAGYAAGAPGATLGKALVASDRAEVAWNATVAVRNEVVSAYQAVMNMQF
ncbi:MAG: flagellar hook-basal body complex protein FliE [Rhodospirillales bacterium]|nr:flagellar hook-basal body complex protein FliE [Rhodospirillales bacterium]